jgi:DnaJ homolog subfamily C member 19
MRMPLDEARQLLGLPLNYTREDVIAAFRRAVKKAHPDLGGTAEMFHKLVEARDRLLAALGTSAPRPSRRSTPRAA